MSDDIHFPDDGELPGGGGDVAPELPVPAEHPAAGWPSDDEAPAPGAAADEPAGWADDDRSHEQAGIDADEDPESHDRVAADAEVPFEASPDDAAAVDAGDEQLGEDAGSDPLGEAVGSALAEGGFDGAWNSAGAVTGWSGTAVAPEPAVTAWAVGVEDPDPDYIDPSLLDR